MSMGSILSAVSALGAISFDNEIRGLLTVLLGSAILMGSVWLIISTNTGFRLGSLIAISAIFGWTVMMAFIWSLYGIGLQGARPTWEVQAIHIGNPSITDNEANPPPEILDDLPNPVTCSTLGDGDCLPKAIQIVRVMGSSAQRAELDSIDAGTIRAELTAFNDALADDDPRKLVDDEIESEVQRLAEEQRIRNEDLTLSELKGVAPDLTDEVERRGWLDLGDWNLETTQAAGEAITAASDYLAHANLGFGETDEQSNSFVVLDAFQQGGKPERLNNGVWERVSNKVVTSAMPRHPTNYTVVQVQRSIYKEPVAGQAPPPTEVDPREPVISVLMERNLGRFRLPSILVTIGSGLLFLASLLMLHTRDLEVRRRLEGEGAAP
ncbi:MAG: hypothetical protein F4129_10950 [Acidimicrobiia bacterium]|nr:hypothetical protein [Acidimicrobiia bacterium]MYE72998.1 hypothetical protein [Acidimicrobiia bacterium]MYH73035.1 hypothetical protein [Acidimicrobiia bacterium]MYH97006.1 hypothetical protein [Acidimicrobiia bacterium]MYJ61345.1 hypothetical protein [Acidimicrobiia bacterium]